MLHPVYKILQLIQIRNLNQSRRLVPLGFKGKERHCLSTIWRQLLHQFYLEAIGSGSSCTNFRANTDTTSNSTLKERYVYGKGNAVLILT
ncbi:hypothetical protein CUMW_258690 [Citrus unshiu]|uniref:Uncharacterized protein n=1 Tax=Citrus unshiu TaxID=55188 RepID=A0A2H5QSV6_CITUN|nr:hypothetical protein CUMW_258690 [Citrus unshiu]